ncbi:major facilitator superfamily domain-containing protein [Boletus edulis BED1]|uniref:Major facilitator superfamily domain-containing protein n=1 Tax=Boletus edulis BED1 TaxID=1328754 RepID=A0AAD4BRS3_BOLED|nr:major facilitator superfamily domain-containing protein [Boletus edulis BED1]
MSTSPTHTMSQCATMNNSVEALNEEKTVSTQAVAAQNTQPAVVVSRLRFFLIMASLWIGNFTAYVNETTSTTAMHVISADLNDLANQNWLATAYLLGFTVTQTLLGKFSDIFGRAQVLLGTMLIFGAGTLWCGFATSMNSLIGARLLQGIGAAGRQSVGVIIVLDLTTADTRGLWLGFFNLASAVGLAIGPVLGAIISVQTDWRWLFWITLILIGVTLVIGSISIRYPVPYRQQRVGLLAQLREVDYVGSVLAIAISSMICIAIEMGNKIFPWNVTEHPIVDINLFKIPNIPIACLINFLTGAGYFGLVMSGIQMFGLILTLGASSVLGANILSLTGRVRLIGVVGGLLYALGSALMLDVGRYTPVARTIGYSVFTGIASGLLYQPSLVVGPMSVQPHQIAGISGFLSFLRTLGGTFATALLTAVFETSFTQSLQGKLPASLVDQGLGLADNHAQYPQYENQILDALVKAYHLGTIPAICFGAIYAIAVLMLRRNVDFVPAWKQRRIAARQASAAKV